MKNYTLQPVLVRTMNFGKSTPDGFEMYTVNIYRTETTTTETGLLWTVEIVAPKGTTRQDFGSYAVCESLMIRTIQGLAIQSGISWPGVYNPD